MIVHKHQMVTSGTHKGVINLAGTHENQGHLVIKDMMATPIYISSSNEHLTVESTSPNQIQSLYT